MSKKHRNSRKDSPKKKVEVIEVKCNYCNHNRAWLHSGKCTRCKK